MCEPFSGRGLYPAVEFERQLDPMAEIGLGAKSISIDVDIARYSRRFMTTVVQASVRPPCHGGRVDAAHDAILADGDAHLARNHEGNAAKHFLFLDTAAFPYSRSYAIYQSFIRWHRGCLLGRPWR